MTIHGTVVLGVFRSALMSESHTGPENNLSAFDSWLREEISRRIQFRGKSSPIQTVETTVPPRHVSGHN